MNTKLLIFAFLLLLTCSCNTENNLLTEGEMLFLKHKGASMPILVRGNVSSDVIILMVHGGIGGTSASHIEDFKGMIEPEYMVAYWDQRHAGSAQGSFSKDEFSIDLMAEDMQMAINLLKHRYGADKKVIAMGHSWGVILGTYYLIHQENQLHAAIFSNGAHSSEHEYSARMDYVHDFAQEMIDKDLSIPETIEVEGESFETLESVVQWTEANDPIDSWENLKILNALVNVVFGYVNQTYVSPSSDASASVSSGELNFQSPYHFWIPKINGLRSGQLLNNTSNETSIQEFYDFTPQMADISLPISLIWGRYDHIVGVEVAEDYYQVIGTPADKKELHILEKSGHSGMFRENVAFSQYVIVFVERHR